VNATDTVDTCKELLQHDCVTQTGLFHLNFQLSTQFSSKFLQNYVLKVNFEQIQNKMNKNQQKRPLRQPRNVAKKFQKAQKRKPSGA
jgi:hypothetical protein